MVAYSIHKEFTDGTVDEPVAIATTKRNAMLIAQAIAEVSDLAGDIVRIIVHNSDSQTVATFTVRRFAI